MKKVLSIILALTLAFSLLPTFASAETTETNAQTIDWSQPIVFDFGSPTVPEEVTNGAFLHHGDKYKATTWELVLFNTRSSVLLGNNKLKTVNSTYGKYIQISPNSTMVDEGKNILTVAMNVPASGIFDFSADVFNSASGATTTATVLNQEKDVEINIGFVDNVPNNETGLPDDDGTTGPRKRVFSTGRGIPVAKTKNWDTAENSAHVDNHIILTITKNASISSILYGLTLTPSTIKSASVDITTNEYKLGDTFTPSVSLNVEGVGDKTYSDLDMAGIVLGVKEADAGVAVANNVFTVEKAGAITFTPTVTVNGKTHEAAPITLNVASNEDEALKEAFEVQKETLTGYVAPSVVSVSAGGSVITPEKNSDGSYDIEAAEENKDGAKFLYWAKGLKANKKIVSFSNKLEGYIPEEDGADWLIAVYDNMLPAKDEYYNANGQLIAIGEKPALPSMAGYGKASDWKQYRETNIYVAEYNGTQPDDVEVTVNGEKKTVPYGTEITCTATAANFKCWTKSNINGKTEIVSAENVYKFKAWEDCSVDAVNEAYIYNGDKFKIVVDSFNAGNETGIMAEFIGFGSNVVEKGIMWNDNKIAMTKPGCQFSVVADEAGTYKGYAIVGNATDGYTLITDGAVTISAAE